MSLLRDAGIEPMLAVTGLGAAVDQRATPSAATRATSRTRTGSPHFATAVARRYGDRVERYILWNEPNQPGWLQPQFECPRPGRCHPVAPHLYRDLVTAAEPGDPPRGPGRADLCRCARAARRRPARRNRPMRPLPFIRAFGCVDDDYERIRTGRCRGFRPALTDGFSYHPHGVLRSPPEPNPNPDEAAIADLPRLRGRARPGPGLRGDRQCDGRPDRHST